MGVKADREARGRALGAAADDRVRYVRGVNGRIWWHRVVPGNSRKVAGSMEGFASLRNAHRAAERACPDLVPLPKPDAADVLVDVPTEVV